MSRCIVGDCLDVLPLLEAGSVQCCVTSPPYFGLRDYGTAKWEGGDQNCAHVGNEVRTVSGGAGKQYTNAGSNRVFSGDCDCDCGAKRVDSQLGLESTPAEYVEKMVEVFREVKRVLREDGTLWLNLGDSYGTGTTAVRQQRSRGLGTGTGDAQDAVPRVGGMAKQLIGIPWRVAFALQADGWYLRQDIIWSKPNPMPESVTDRCTKAHEYIFMLSKSQSYYYDADAIAEPVTDSTAIRLLQDIDNQKGSDRVPNKTNGTMKAVGGKKFTSDMGGGGTTFVGHSGYTKADGTSSLKATRNKRSVWTVTTKPFKGAHFATFPPDLIEPCILAGCPVGGTVLDPFGGAGTTGMVAESLGRKWLLIELNPEYEKISRERTAQTGMAFA